jgi:hypothetical protein
MKKNLATTLLLLLFALGSFAQQSMYVSASVSKVTISQAKAKGYRACGICY